MKNYRNAFLAALIANVVLVGAGFGVWWRAHRPAALQQVSPPPMKNMPQPSAGEGGLPPAAAAEVPLVPVQISAERLQSIGVKFGMVERKPVQDEIRATGTVAIDETRLAYVQTRFSGYIQRVYADATYKYIRKGQPLFTIYSPELAAAQREYLVAKQQAQALSQSTVPGVATGAATLLEASADRLKQWNIPEGEIARLESTGQASQELEIASPVSGYIMERKALPNAYVQPETKIYTVADLSTAWVFAQVFQNDLGRIRPGAAATITMDAYPGRQFHGRVDFVYPDVDLTTRTARVRLVFSNPNLTLTPGMFVNVVLQVPLGNQLVINVSGVLQSGTRQIVFVDRGGGLLEPREVALGPQAGEEYVVLRGLKAGERIVTSANFLVDSESQLQAALGTFIPPPPGAGAAAAMNAPAAKATGQIEFSTEPATPRKGTNLYRVKLTASDGSPIAGAQVTVRSFMPAMPQMGMAAINVITPLAEKGGGIYEGQVTLETGGTWQITVTATKDGTVLAARQFSLIAEGGM